MLVRRIPNANVDKDHRSKRKRASDTPPTQSPTREQPVLGVDAHAAVGGLSPKLRRIGFAELIRRRCGTDADKPLIDIVSDGHSAKEGETQNHGHDSAKCTQVLPTVDDTHAARLLARERLRSFPEGAYLLDVSARWQTDEEIRPSVHAQKPHVVRRLHAQGYRREFQINVLAWAKDSTRILDGCAAFGHGPQEPSEEVAAHADRAGARVEKSCGTCQAEGVEIDGPPTKRRLDVCEAAPAQPQRTHRHVPEVVAPGENARGEIEFGLRHVVEVRP
mmetsp:Transcript_88775/g.250056  ORF Transcript_88775/g.250056 Transcript_88775/m.250056 type:complete len:276 (+) Transcript_88775:229-1056(+)